MKVEQKKVEKFNPVTITIETKEEFDFLRGLTLANDDARKEECNDYNHEIDTDLWRKLDKVRK